MRSSAGPSAASGFPGLAGEQPAGRARRFTAAVVALATVVGLPVIPHPAMAQQPDTGAAADAGDLRSDALLATPDYVTPVPQDNLIATAPGLEQQTPRPQVTVNVLAPIFYNSNAAFAPSNGIQALEGSPIVRVTVADQLGNLPIRISAGSSVEWDRFANAPSADWDKVRPFLRLQYVDSANDQAFSPYFAYVTRIDFDPTLSRQFATRQDLNLGVNKVWNFDRDFNRVLFSGNSSAGSVWRFGLTVGVQQRFRQPAPASYAAFFVPSVSYVISEQWNAGLAIDITRRWFYPNGGVDRRDLFFEPVATLEFLVPGEWLGGPGTARLFGSPAIDGLIGFERNTSNVSSANYNQLSAGLAFKLGWRF